MSIQEVSSEQLAQIFHHYTQALAPDFACMSDNSHGSWNEIPLQERSRMVAAARLALMDLEATASQKANSREYFAKPGEAEWGC